MLYLSRSALRRAMFRQISPVTFALKDIVDDSKVMSSNFSSFMHLSFYCFVHLTFVSYLMFLSDVAQNA